eukprot:360488-Chlamydomonas_euryale.AAC.6
MFVERELQTARCVFVARQSARLCGVVSGDRLCGVVSGDRLCGGAVWGCVGKVRVGAEGGVREAFIKQTCRWCSTCGVSRAVQGGQGGVEWAGAGRVPPANPPTSQAASITLTTKHPNQSTSKQTSNHEIQAPPLQPARPLAESHSYGQPFILPSAAPTANLCSRRAGPQAPPVILLSPNRTARPHETLPALLPVQIDRAKTPWVVVGGHRPIYISSTAAEGPDCDQVVSAALRAALEPLLLRYNVDLTLHGHHHTYQRTCPVGGGVCLGHDENGAARGPVHLVIGHGGAGLSMNMQHPPPSFLRVSQLWWGYARMHASPTELHIEVVSDADGSLMDEFKLVRPRH